MKLGDKVLVQGYVKFEYDEDGNKRAIQIFYENPIEAILIGEVIKCEGKFTKGKVSTYGLDGPDYEQNTFKTTRRVKVYETRTDLRSKINHSTEDQIREIK